MIWNHAINACPDPGYLKGLRKGVLSFGFGNLKPGDICVVSGFALAGLQRLCKSSLAIF